MSSYSFLVVFLFCSKQGPDDEKPGVDDLPRWRDPNGNGRLRWQKHLKRDYGIRGIQREFSGSVVISGDLIILNAGAPVWLSIKKRDEKFGADPLLELKDNRLSRVWQNRNMRSHFPSPVYRNG